VAPVPITSQTRIKKKTSLTNPRKIIFVVLQTTRGEIEKAKDLSALKR
jgi:hypothetical protein